MQGWVENNMECARTRFAKSLLSAPQLVLVHFRQEEAQKDATHVSTWEVTCRRLYMPDITTCWVCKLLLLPTDLNTNKDGMYYLLHLYISCWSSLPCQLYMSSHFCFPISLLPCVFLHPRLPKISPPRLLCSYYFPSLIVSSCTCWARFLQSFTLLSPFLNSLVSSSLSFSQRALISPCIPHSLEPQSLSIISLSPLSVIFCVCLVFTCVSFVPSTYLSCVFSVPPFPHLPLFFYTMASLVILLFLGQSYFFP